MTLVTRQTLLQFRNLQEMPHVDEPRQLPNQRDMFRDVRAKFSELGVLVDEAASGETSAEPSERRGEERKEGSEKRTASYPPPSQSSPPALTRSASSSR